MENNSNLEQLWNTVSCKKKPFFHFRRTITLEKLFSRRCPFDFVGYRAIVGRVRRIGAEGKTTRSTKEKLGELVTNSLILCCTAATGAACLCLTDRVRGMTTQRAAAAAEFGFFLVLQEKKKNSLGIRQRRRKNWQTAIVV